MSCEVRWDDEQKYLVTQFNDGWYIPLGSDDSDEGIKRSNHLGYDGDTWRMNRDHAIAHTFLAEASGQPHSPVLRAQVSRRPLGFLASDYEEMVVFAFQRYVRVGKGHPTLDNCYDLYGKSADELASEFRDIVGG